MTAGTPITYTIVVTDKGPSDTSQLNVVDNLPAQGLTNISSPNLPSGVTFNSTTDSWSLASLPSGQSVTLKLAGTVPSGATGTSYTNTATASASDASPVNASDTDTLNTQATLAITNTDGVSSVVAGSADTYTIVVSNSGPSERLQPERGRHPAHPGPHQHHQPESALGGHLQLGHRHLEPGLPGRRASRSPSSWRARSLGSHGHLLR